MRNVDSMFDTVWKFAIVAILLSFVFTVACYVAIGYVGVKVWNAPAVQEFLEGKNATPDNNSDTVGDSDNK